MIVYTGPLGLIWASCTSYMLQRMAFVHAMAIVYLRNVRYNLLARLEEQKIQVELEAALELSQGQGQYEHLRSVRDDLLAQLRDSTTTCRDELLNST